MDVLQQEHCAGGGLGRRRRPGQKKPAQIVEGTVTNLFGVVQNAQQVRAARKIQPHQMTDEMGSLDGFVGLLRTSMMARLEDADDSAFELLPSHGRSITVLNFKAKGEHVAQE